MELTKISNKSVNEILNIERKKKFGLSNIKKFLAKIGNPERNLKVIHVAGTNGKGSVCAMIDAVLGFASYKVGMFTSPHLIRLNERIRINNRLILTEDLDRLSRKVISLQKRYKINLSFFETITVIAYLYFNEKNIDYAILETGMGGRLDATNVVNPVLSIITNIGLEHTDVLGNTLKDIAKEKAGIIKENTVTVTNAKGIALDMIKKIAKHKNAELVIAENNVKTNLKGKYQLENASTAATALRQLGINEKFIKEGLKKVFWPGRFEFISRNVLLDCAHNPDGIKALVNSIRDLNYCKLIVIFGAMNDKNVKSMSKKLKYDKIILTKAKIDKAYSASELKKYFKNPVLTDNLKEAIEKAKEISSKKDLILITGSIFLIGEVYSFFNHQTPA